MNQKLQKMTLQETINQTKNMTKQEFETLFFHILQIATTKYNISFLPKNFMTKQKNDLVNKKENTDDMYNSIVAEQFLAGYDEGDNIYNTL